MCHQKLSLRLMSATLLLVLLTGCSALSAAPLPHFWVVTASSDNTARVWDAATGKTIAVLQGHTGPVLTANFSPDGKWIVTASNDKTARMWDAATGNSVAVLSGHEAAVTDAVFSPDGKLIATAGGDLTVRIWDTATGNALVTLGTVDVEDFSQIKGLAFSPDGESVAATAALQGWVRVWHIGSGKQIAELSPKQSRWFNSVMYSPDGRFIVTASGQAGHPVQPGDTTSIVWEPLTGKIITEFNGHSSVINKAVFSPDGKWVVTASADNTAQVWEAATGKLVSVLSGHKSNVYTAVFSPDSKWVVTASGDGTARVWEAATGKVISMLGGHAGLVYSAVFSPDGRFVVTASRDNTARVWDAATGKMITELSGHTKEVNGAVFSPDEK